MTSSTNTTANGSSPLIAKRKITESVESTVANTDIEFQDALPCGYTYINPFIHRIPIDNGFDLAKIYVLTLILVPIRAVGCVISLLTAWVFACIGLYGTTLEDLKQKPIDGWRKRIKAIVAASMRCVYSFGSFQFITFKGKRASPKEAPVLVIAPHSSYVDSIVVVACGPPSIVAKQETSTMPLLGKIINYSQPIYVQREDPNSRVNTIREIIDRARSDQEWPQVAIFPEGTCTNRSTLIRFKPGAFYPGVPVQPVLLRYPNKYDTCTWTWDGPGILRLLWLSMASFYTRCEIEFLPVYVPNEAEKADANLFARNVRKVMASALGVPTSEYSFEDVIVMDRAKQWKIPFAHDIVEIERKLSAAGLLGNGHEKKLVAAFHDLDHLKKLDPMQFANLLKIDMNHVNSSHLFSLFDPDLNGFVQLKNYLLVVTYLNMINEEQMSYLRAISPIFADKDLRLTRESFTELMRHVGNKIAPQKINAIFFAVDKFNKGLITFSEFETHVEGLKEYKFLHKKLENVRRGLKN